MNYTVIDDIPVFGEPLQNAVDQMINCKRTADKCVLMADHHLGYAVPIGGVVAYKNHISPSGVGYDIACGNKAVKLDCTYDDIKDRIPQIMDDIFSQISFGVGMKNKEIVEHELFEEGIWDEPLLCDLEGMARSQLGTIGSGNHYVDIFKDLHGSIWVGVHFGSRGLGHKIATHFVKAGGGLDGINVDPVLLDVREDIGKDYIRHMELAGRYAYAGRDWVCSKVASIIGANEIEEIHNHHNFAWFEQHGNDSYWVIRKGATPAFPGQRGFIGSSMGENSVIVEGVDSETSKVALYSTVHGAGRVMSRTEAAGKRKWRQGKSTNPAHAGKITPKMMHEWVSKANVELRGAGVDESPHCYKRLDEVLGFHRDTIQITHVLQPLGVAMAGSNEPSPYKD